MFKHLKSPPASFELSAYLHFILCNSVHTTGVRKKEKWQIGKSVGGLCVHMQCFHTNRANFVNIRYTYMNTTVYVLGVVNGILNSFVLVNRFVRKT